MKKPYGHHVSYKKYVSALRVRLVLQSGVTQIIMNPGHSPGSGYRCSSWCTRRPAVPSSGLMYGVCLLRIGHWLPPDPERSATWGTRGIIQSAIWICLLPDRTPGQDGRTQGLEVTASKTSCSPGSLQNRKAVFAHLKSEQIPPFWFCRLPVWIVTACFPCTGTRRLHLHAYLQPVGWLAGSGRGQDSRPVHPPLWHRPNWALKDPPAFITINQR